jgi:hypothetical protein
VHNDLQIHLLGYYIDPDNSELASELLDIQNFRKLRNQKIVEKLQKLGLNISLAEIEAKSKVGQTGRPHIAQVLVEKKIARTLDDAFSRFLKKGAIAYVPRSVLEAGKAIALIKNAGGIAVLAHPVIIDGCSLQRIPEILAELVPAGLGGLEVYYPVHSSKNQKTLSALAERYGLVVTGGSDYHGDIRPGTMLAGGKNVYVPVEVLHKLKEKLGK